MTADDEAWLREVALKMEVLAKRAVVEQATKRTRHLERAFTNLLEAHWRIVSAADGLRDDRMTNAAQAAAQATAAEGLAPQGVANGE